MNITALSLILYIVLLSSCRKDPKIEFPNPYEPEKIQLVSSPGSWWKYNWYSINSLGTETSLGVQDCVYVVGDTLINGYSYTHYAGDLYPYTTEQHLYWRDSSHYVVNSYGLKLFSTYSQMDTMRYSYGPLWTVYDITNGEKTEYIVPAGTFMAYDLQTHYYNTDGSPFTECEDVFIKHNLFANGIGILSQQTGYINLIQNYCQYDEKRLVDYYIAP